MRLFFAVGFSEAEKDLLAGNIAKLKNHCARGNFTRRENIHITLAFLGEVDRSRLPDVIKAAADVDAAPFDITVCGAGRFGQIVWLGVGSGGKLDELSKSLRSSLDEKGIGYDKKPFSPHLTLCREAEFSEGCSVKTFEEGVKPLKKRVTSFDLMESTRVGGKLIYKKLYSKKI